VNATAPRWSSEPMTSTTTWLAATLHRTVILPCFIVTTAPLATDGCMPQIS